MKSWKTTAVGIASLIAATMTALHEVSFMAALKDPQFQIAVFIGILGIVAKDSSVTGGTVGQPSSAKALRDANQGISETNPPVPETKASISETPVLPNK
jgi:hypothetical protein